MTAIQNNPIINQSFLYKSGLVLRNGKTAGTLYFSDGACRDSNDVMDMIIGQPNVQNQLVVDLQLDSSVNGLNGLDEGVLAADTMYAIYMIADSRYYKETGCIATLASNEAPALPAGYDSLRLIGFWATKAAAAEFETGYYSGVGKEMQFTYEFVRATAVTAGTATSYTSVSVANVVPPVSGRLVFIAASFTPAAPGDIFYVRGLDGTGAYSSDLNIIIGQVAAIGVFATNFVPVLLEGGLAKVAYKVSAGTASLEVAGFTVSV